MSDINELLDMIVEGAEATDVLDEAKRFASYISVANALQKLNVAVKKQSEILFAVDEFVKMKRRKEDPFRGESYTKWDEDIKEARAHHFKARARIDRLALTGGRILREW